ncbi:MAG: nitroreductase family protein [Hominenteromicrobium sp.]
MDVIFKRTSVRAYTQQPVEDDKLELLLRAGMAAPSAGNQQPWEFYLVKNKAVLQALAQCSSYAKCVQHAAAAIIPCYRTTGLRHAAYAEIDLSAATENILLEAETLGLGAVWLGIAPLRERMDAVRALLGAPDTLEPFAIVSLGYPLTSAGQEDRFDPARIHTVL